METIKVTDTTWTDYPITVGIRIRLTPEQKQLIKETYDSKANCGPSVSEGRGGIQVVTQSNPKKELVQAMGVDRLVLASLLGSNERHPISMLKRWEDVLDLKGKLIVKKQLDDAYKSLLKHLEV